MLLSGNASPTVSTHNTNAMSTPYYVPRSYLLVLGGLCTSVLVTRRIVMLMWPRHCDLLTGTLIQLQLMFLAYTLFRHRRNTWSYIIKSRVLCVYGRPDMDDEMAAWTGNAPIPGVTPTLRVPFSCLLLHGIASCIVYLTICIPGAPDVFLILYGVMYKELKPYESAMYYYKVIDQGEAPVGYYEMSIKEPQYSHFTLIAFDHAENLACALCCESVTQESPLLVVCKTSFSNVLCNADRLNFSTGMCQACFKKGYEHSAKAGSHPMQCLGCNKANVFNIH